MRPIIQPKPPPEQTPLNEVIWNNDLKYERFLHDTIDMALKRGKAPPTREESIVAFIRRIDLIESTSPAPNFEVIGGEFNNGAVGMYNSTIKVIALSGMWTPTVDRIWEAEAAKTGLNLNNASAEQLSQKPYLLSVRKAKKRYSKAKDAYFLLDLFQFIAMDQLDFWEKDFESTNARFFKLQIAWRQFKNNRAVYKRKRNQVKEYVYRELRYSLLMDDSELGGPLGTIGESASEEMDVEMDDDTEMDMGVDEDSGDDVDSEYEDDYGVSGLTL